MADRNEEWWEGNVMGSLGNLRSVNCLFQIKYANDPKMCEVELYEEFLNHDLIILD